MSHIDYTIKCVDEGTAFHIYSCGTVNFSIVVETKHKQRLPIMASISDLRQIKFAIDEILEMDKLERIAKMVKK